MAKVQLRACLVSNRVGLGGAKSASFTRRTASCELFLRGSFLSFRSVSTKESRQIGPPCTPQRQKGSTLILTKHTLRKKIVESVKQGVPKSETARRFGVDRATVKRC